MSVTNELWCVKLTAEQVREAIERNFNKVAVLDDGKPVEWRNDWVCKIGIDYKAITEELNAALGGGECGMVMLDAGGKAFYEHREYIMHCVNCHHEFGYVQYDEDGDTWMNDKPRFCPNCGKAVKR